MATKCVHTLAYKVSGQQHCVLLLYPTRLEAVQHAQRLGFGKIVWSRSIDEAEQLSPGCRDILTRAVAAKAWGLLGPVLTTLTIALRGK